MDSSGKCFSSCIIHFVLEKLPCCSFYKVGTIVISFSQNNGNNVFVLGKHHFFLYSRGFSPHSSLSGLFSSSPRMTSGFSNSMRVELLQDGASSSRGMFIRHKDIVISRQADRESHTFLPHMRRTCSKLSLWDGTLGELEGLLPPG